MVLRCRDPDVSVLQFDIVVFLIFFKNQSDIFNSLAVNQTQYEFPTTAVHIVFQLVLYKWATKDQYFQNRHHVSCSRKVREWANSLAYRYNLYLSSGNSFETGPTIK